MNYKPYKHLPPFKGMVLQNFPFIEEDFDAITNYQLLCKIVEYLRNVIANELTMEENVTNLYNEFVSLKNYIDNYFDNLDVQEEINNKLDEMATDGTLESIISSYISEHVIYYYDTLNELISANVSNNIVVKTFGYYEKNDGGDGTYYISNEELTADGGSIVALNNGLFAKLIINDTITTKQFGAKGDGITNDTEKIQALFDYVSANKKDGITILVNGMHLVNKNLIIEGTSDDLLKNICLKGIDGNRDYGLTNNLKYGFTFIADYSTNSFDYNYGIRFNYCVSPRVENLRIQTNENVPNGDIPLNNLMGISCTHTNGIGIFSSIISKFYKGISLSGCGLSRIENNNVSCCNIGISLLESGDNSLTNNYINTCGWNIRELDGTLKSKFSTLPSAKVFGIGLYLGASSNGSIRGGKIEWCLKGIWQDYSNSNIISSINFDRCSVYAIGIDGHYTFENNTIISNNVFKGCGGISVNGDSKSGHAISMLQADNISIINNAFISTGGSDLGTFKKDGVYYGAKSANIYAIRLNRGIISNNTFNGDTSPYNLEFSQTCVFDNVYNSDNPYISGNMVCYRQQPNLKEYFRNDSNFTYGNFDLNDVIHSYATPNIGYRCSTAGTVQEINTTVTVLTDENTRYPNDGSVLKLQTNTYPAGLTTGAYVTIDGVTGIKRIMNIRYRVGDGWYIKLNSACDVAVINATMQNSSPVFTQFTTN